MVGGVSALAGTVKYTHILKYMHMYMYMYASAKFDLPPIGEVELRFGGGDALVSVHGERWTTQPNVSFLPPQR